MTAGPRSVQNITLRRSQRSTRAPANGAMTMAGRLALRMIRVYWVTEPERSSAQMPRAKLVSPEPSSETSWPIQMVLKVFMPCAGWLSDMCVLSYCSRFHGVEEHVVGAVGAVLRPLDFDPIRQIPLEVPEFLRFHAGGPGSPQGLLQIADGPQRSVVLEKPHGFDFGGQARVGDAADAERRQRSVRQESAQPGGRGVGVSPV